MSRVLVFFVLLGFASVSMAQQLEPNTPGGSAKINGVGPTGVGNPLQIQVN